MTVYAIIGGTGLTPLEDLEIRPWMRVCMVEIERALREGNG